MKTLFLIIAIMVGINANAQIGEEKIDSIKVDSLTVFRHTAASLYYPEAVFKTDTTPMYILYTDTLTMKTGCVKGYLKTTYQTGGLTISYPKNEYLDHRKKPLLNKIIWTSGRYYGNF